MTETVAAFERHLLDRLDDTAAWSAYADYLTEQGEPRGDFMRVQLALEDESLPKAERRALKRTEKELQHKYIFEEQLNLDSASKEYVHGAAAKFKCRRGWLTEATGISWELSPGGGEDEFANWRWVHTLELLYSEITLAETPIPRNLRSFKLGCKKPGGGYMQDLVEFAEASERLEKLDLCCGQIDTSEVFRLSLVNLYSLSVHCRAMYSVGVLANNSSMSSLKTLILDPPDYGYFPDNSVRDVVNSPYLKRLEHLRLNRLSNREDAIELLIESGLIFTLKSLDLRHGCVTDAGASALVKALDGTPHALASMKLGDNAISGDGVAALRRLKLTLDAPDQHAPGDDAYLTQGDFE